MLARCPSSEKILSTSFKVERSCDVCFTSSCSEEQVSMLRVPIRSSISSSIQELFKTSHMDGPNQRFCGVCGSDQDATTEVSLVKPPELLIVHLKRFTQVGPGNFIKNSLAVACDRSISLTEKTAEPCTVHNYCLFSVIEHSGTCGNGHYTCYVQEPRSRQWYFCNDSFVEKSDIGKYKYPYILFYRLFV